MLKKLTILVVFACSYSYGFERNGWPGEGIPVISFAKKEITFCEKPSNDDSCKLQHVTKDVKMSLVDYSGLYIKQTLYITKIPVEMIAKRSFSIGNHEIDKGDKLTKYQYAAEGAYYIGIGDKVIQVDLYNYEEHLEGFQHKPVVEWWVKFIGKGWAQVNEENFIFHDREF
ncbi:hypothetical protein N9J26_00475 [bacterium]|nr:hypothetical protein [bacterium]